MQSLHRVSWPLWVLAFIYLTPGTTQAQLVLPDSVLDAALVTPYQGKWRTIIKQEGQPDQEGPIYTEVADLVKRKGKSVLRRVQTVEMPAAQGGGIIVDTLILDAQTLAPLSKRFHHPQLTAHFDFDWKSKTLTQHLAGQEPVKVKLEQPMFDAFSLGLALKALPLEENYQVTFPSYMVNARDAAQNSKWWVTARVIGSEMFDPGDGNLVDTWVVETDWVGEDHAVSPGGGSGGTTYIIKDTKAGAAHVANVVTEWQPGMFGWIVMRDGL